MDRVICYTIPPEYDGKKVIAYLRGEAGISCRLLKTLKQTKNGITLNGEHIRTIDLLHTGDILNVNIPCPESEIEPVEFPLEVLYEDDDLIIINKDPFIACHPTHNHQGDTLANALSFYLQKKGKSSVFRAIGRLDKGTSGIVICALNKHAAALIPKTVTKEYIAVITGKLDPQGTIDAPIYRPDPMKTVRAVGEGGDRAVTHWEVIKQNDTTTLARIRIETGRTHQIRVHFASIGAPLVGDSLYGTDPLNIGHQLLHCERVTFVHPITGEEIIVSASLPDDMKKIADKI